MNRSKLAERFATSSSGATWKTFVIEAHADGDPDALLHDAFSAGVRPTDDAHLHVVDGDVPFVVDSLDSRFWRLHTTAPASEAEPHLKPIIESHRSLDWMWLPSGHLGNVWPNTEPVWVATDYSERLRPGSDGIADLRLRVGGKDAAKVLATIEERHGGTVPLSAVALRPTDPNYGTVHELVSRDGRFIAHGRDFALHQAIVRRVVDHYRRLVEGAESRCLRYVELPSGGALLKGSPIVLRLSRPISDLDWFLGQLFSSREPFRLWAVPHLVTAQRAEVEAVDLHVGQRLRFDITPSELRVYLFDGGCGNTIARLACNLQHYLDANLTIVDPELDTHLRQSA